MIALAVGLLPIFATLAAYLVNIHVGGKLEGHYACFPFSDGCISISRAARSGPGLLLFRAVMIPVAFLLVLFWRDVGNWLSVLTEGNAPRSRYLRALGSLGATFLVLYVMALGGEGETYRWMRRYGVTIYFGGTALAQLMLASVLWPPRQRLAGGVLSSPVMILTGLVSFQWALGVASVIKRLVLTDPELIDRIENIIEWWFALPMCLVFVVVGWMMARVSGTVRRRKSASH